MGLLGKWLRRERTPVTVVLRSERSSGGRHGLWARMTPAGELVIEGQDLGPDVERILGCSEYEWTITVAAEHVPAYLDALGGRPGSDPLGALERRVREDDGCATTRFLEEHEIPFTLWTRRGE